MLPPDYYSQAPQSIIDEAEELELEIIRLTAESVKKTSEQTDDEMMRKIALAGTLIVMGVAHKKIAKMEKDFHHLLRKTLKISHSNDKKLYRLAGKEIPSLKGTGLVKSLKKIEKERPIRKVGKKLGVRHRGRVVPLNKYIYSSAKYAQTGTEALRKATASLGKNGIVSLYGIGSGARNFASSIRTTISNRLRDVAHMVTDWNVEYTDHDLMVLTAHSGARPTHKVWQGKIVSRKGTPGYLTLDDIGYGEVTGFHGINCRHDWNPYFGFNPWTEEELADIDPPDVTIDGKTYTYYEVTQVQRRMEREIRQVKQEISAANGIGDRTIASRKTKQLKKKKEEYKEFSKQAGVSTFPWKLGKIDIKKAVDPIVEELDLSSSDDEIRAWIRKHPKIFNVQKFEEHIKGHKRYNGKKSYLIISEDEARALIDLHAGNGQLRRYKNGEWMKKEFIINNDIIGVYLDRTGSEHMTNKFMIIYNNKGGVHIVPTRR
ncbi:MAG: polymorphic toxin type 50 domain-containing protein [Tissierellia bacterium]|nr:polymorphic toxin type 50 domain-containing protein [Tissierellia bacterium]